MLNILKKIIKYFIFKRKYPTSKMYYGALLDKESLLGNNTVLFKNVLLQNAQVSDYSYVQSNSIIMNTTIGRFCSIASNVSIGLPEHPMTMVSTNPVFYDNTQPLPFSFTGTKIYESNLKQTVIEDDVWIGQNAMVKSGVIIRVGAVVGAGAVVTKDVEPYSIVAGVPAKHIKYRFESDIRSNLLASKWWTFDEEKLTKIAPYFKTPQMFLDKLKVLDEI